MRRISPKIERSSLNLQASCANCKRFKEVKKRCSDPEMEDADFAENMPRKTVCRKWQIAKCRIDMAIYNQIDR